MSDSYTNLLYHVVFSTKDRRPLTTSQCEIHSFTTTSAVLFVDSEVFLWSLMGLKIMFTFYVNCAPIMLCQTCCANSKQMRRGGCMISFPSSKFLVATWIRRVHRESIER